MKKKKQIMCTYNNETSKDYKGGEGGKERKGGEVSSS